MKVGNPVALKLAAAFQPVLARVEAIAPASSPLETGLVREEAYKGLAPPQFYCVTALVSNPADTFKAGMTGTAKVLIARHSLAGFVWKDLRDFVQRKVW